MTKNIYIYFEKVLRLYLFERQRERAPARGGGRGRGRSRLPASRELDLGLHPGPRDQDLSPRAPLGKNILVGTEFWVLTTWRIEDSWGVHTP